MNAEQILKLIEAGYTKAEIQEMIPPGGADHTPIAPEAKATSAEAPFPSASAEASEAGREEPEKADQPDLAESDIIKAINSQMAAMSSAIEKLSKAVIMPTIGNVTPMGIDDIVRDFFKEE